MAQFSVNTTRFDPYKNMKFRIKWDGKYVAGVSKVSALNRSTEVVTHREGGDPSHSRVSPSVTKHEPITLERGVTHDPEFEKWANLVYNTNGDAAMSLANFRKDIVLDFLDEQGVVAISYHIFRCWVSEYVALPELDSNAHAVAIQHLILPNEGWERDTAVAEPKET
jgi:phage tail-like protein